MKANEFTNEAEKPAAKKTAAKKVSKKLKAGDFTPHDYNPGWQELNFLKEVAKDNGDRMAGELQLFVPRVAATVNTKSERIKSLFDRPSAWDDEGNLNPEFQDWVDKGAIGESARPILHAGKAVSPPGRNKPVANLWTSTAQKRGDGSYTSDWSRYTESLSKLKWFSDVGYLFRIKPGALILELDNDRDAERVFRTFNDLGKFDAYEKYSSDTEMAMRAQFPWDEVVKHFDAVTHSGASRYSGYGYERGDRFMFGWDVESTAWFDTSFLEYLGPVKVANTSSTTDDEY
jgi:hypothetical protein